VLEGHGRDDLPEGGAATVWIDRLRSVNGGRWRRSRSVHHHKHHTAADVERALDDAGLEQVARWGSTERGLDAVADEEARIKTVYIARHARA
jgi:hypothetical protein